MRVEPRKYWSIGDDDVRGIVLQRFVKTLDERIFDLKSVDEIISACIDAFKKFEITSTEETQLREAILKQNTLIADECLKNTCEELVSLGTKKLSIISLGCGDESVFERAISEDMVKNFPEIELEWLGIDTEDYRNPTSFLKDKTFVKVAPDAEVEYRTLFETKNPIVLIGRWSYHHLGINFQKFLDRCTGISKVILVEEPASAKLWMLADYRIMRIAYDLLGNLIMSRAWASEFMKDAQKFNIQYLVPETLPQSVRVINFQKVLPETSLVIATT